jgi:hypothetical protein
MDSSPVVSGRVYDERRTPSRISPCGIAPYAGAVLTPARRRRAGAQWSGRARDTLPVERAYGDLIALLREQLRQ